MNFKGLMQNFDRNINKCVQKARREVITTKDNTISSKVEEYRRNESIKIEANKIMRSERVKSTIKGWK